MDVHNPSPRPLCVWSETLYFMSSLWLVLLLRSSYHLYLIAATVLKWHIRFEVFLGTRLYLIDGDC